MSTEALANGAAKMLIEWRSNAVAETFIIHNRKSFSTKKRLLLPFLKSSPEYVDKPRPILVFREFHPACTIITAGVNSYEYLAIRKYALSVCFDFMRFGDGKDEKVSFTDQDYASNSHFYNHYIRANPKGTGGYFQSWIRGKAIIRGDRNIPCHYDYPHKYEPFLTGYDVQGNEVFQDCSNSNEKAFVLTYFRKNVLNKYYNEPDKYTVDGWSVHSKFFSLKIDNHSDDYGAVFLIELRTLPLKEQLHWKHYNYLLLQKGISAIYYKTMIEGSWAESSGTPDLIFKEKYKALLKNWREKFGWDIYKPLEKANAHRLISLHIPTSNNIKTFCEQILSLVIITIDSLNEKELAKGLILEEGDKGITKFQKFLESHGFQVPDMFVFLRHLQNLRSGLAAHRFSQSNKNVKKAIAYFGFTGENYVDVARDIFVKTIQTLNLLESRF